jgi:nicotinate-nucleotide adenylyltransferase
MNHLRKIALFGGTFDPVHLGHVHLARLAVEMLDLNEVRFIPCRISPHKTDRIPSSPEDRLKMLEIATVDLPWAVVDDLELRRDGVSFSWQTAEIMAERFPGCRLFWIMGADQWEALPRWAKPERLSQLVEFIVFARSGKTPAPRDGVRAHFLTGSHPASASAIRASIHDGGDPSSWLHPEVASWIDGHGLYAR